VSVLVFAAEESISMRACLCLVLVLPVVSGQLLADEPVTFFVSLDGHDEAERDGRSAEAAWRSLAYACERVPAGNNLILLGPGTFVAQRTARPPSGVTIVGLTAVDPASGKSTASRIIAAKDWPLADKITDMGPEDEYLIDLRRVQGVTIRDLTLCGDPERPITGAIHVRDGDRIVLQDLTVRDFRWNGLALQHSQRLLVERCLIENASLDRLHYHGGLIRTRWIKDSQVQHNRIVATRGAGYGYKGGGHEGVRLHRNWIQVVSEFAIESAHENEYGLEIDQNYLNRCVSVPKGGQGDDPNKRGFEYSVWIHNNLMTDSYAVEGPRNHLRLSRNYIRCEKTGGRIYTHHGGNNRGPIWIHHNVVENADRAFVWMNEGLAENIHVYNNTVTFAEAGDRAGSILGAWSGERLNDWIVTNNVFIAPESQPRKLLPAERGVPDKISASNNWLINITGAPDGNLHGDAAVLRLEGEKPWPWYAPRAADSPVVDRGTDVGLPFLGVAPDLGAIEWGETWKQTIGPAAD
jgi:hypothetical protein